MRLTVALLVVGLTAAAAFGVAGYFLFTRPHVDPLTKADAIVVLGGDIDGRVDYGLDLARQGYANTVVLSNSYEPDDGWFKQKCATGTATITIICFTPDPWTTRGEAMFTAKLAKERGWHHLIVVSWNYHMMRARYIFGQCFDGQLTMHPVPRPYNYSALTWAYVYAYQYGAFVKAATLGC